MTRLGNLFNFGFIITLMTGDPKENERILGCFETFNLDRSGIQIIDFPNIWNMRLFVVQICLLFRCRLEHFRLERFKCLVRNVMVRREKSNTKAQSYYWGHTLLCCYECWTCSGQMEDLN